MFSNFKLVVTLTEVMRQNDATEEAFRTALMNIRNGKAQVDDYNLLATRIAGIDNSKTLQFMDQVPVYLTSTNASARQYNIRELAKISRLNSVIRQCTLQAVHCSPQAQKLPAEDFQNLEAIVNLCVGARVMCIANLWVTHGLMNGSMGTVRYIVYTANKKSPDDLPEVIIVEMDNYTGPSLEGFPNRYVPFMPQTNYTINHNNKRLERTQFPLKLCFALTIHKAQGNKNFNC